MNIAYTSDLHIDVSDWNREASLCAAEVVAELCPDVFVLAGDVGNTLEDLRRALGMFEDAGIVKLFVPGNHDVWVESHRGGMLDSRVKYERLIPEMCREMGFHDLGQEPLMIGDIGFAGSIGWYDYSFADPRLGLREDAYWEGRYGEEIWWDKKMTRWTPGRAGEDGGGDRRMRDSEVCAEMVGRLDDHLSTIENRVERIVTVIHTLPFLTGLPRSEPPYYFDAYTGSDRLGKTLAAHPKTIHCISGHKHTTGDWEVNGIGIHRRTLGRIGETDDITAAARRAVGLLEI